MSAIEKHTHADLRRRYPLYIEVGLLLTLALLVTAVNVEWRSEYDFEIEQNEQETVEMKQIEQTQQIEKPPPPPEPQVPVEVPNEESVEDATIDLSAELDVSGLGAGCDEEALDAIRSTKFNPGKQRGKPVKVRMSQAIQFRLD